MPSKLNTDYRRYLITLRHLKEQVKEVELKVRTLKEAGATESDEEPNEAGELFSGADGKLKSATLTEHVFVAIRDARKSVTSAEVRQALASQGYTPKGANFNVTLFKTLQRLKEQGKISGEKRSDVWHFWPSRAVPVSSEGEGWD